MVRGQARVCVCVCSVNTVHFAFGPCPMRHTIAILLRIRLVATHYGTYYMLAWCSYTTNERPHMFRQQEIRVQAYCCASKAALLKLQQTLRGLCDGWVWVYRYAKIKEKNPH